jgi:hypothetical protein
MKKTFIDSIDVSTRGKRRKAMGLVIDLLEKIRIAEELYMERTPINLQSSRAYSEADYTDEAIITAIIGLLDAY